MLFSLLHLSASRGNYGNFRPLPLRSLASHHCVLVGSASTMASPLSHFSSFHSAQVLEKMRFLHSHLHTQSVFQPGGSLGKQSCIRQSYFHISPHFQRSSTCNYSFHSFCFSGAPTWHHFWLSFRPSRWLSHPSPWKVQSLCKLPSFSLSVLQQWDRWLVAPRLC